MFAAQEYLYVVYYYRTEPPDHDIHGPPRLGLFARLVEAKASAAKWDQGPCEIGRIKVELPQAWLTLSELDD